MADGYAAVNQLYNKALPEMQRLRLSAEGKYTLWLGANGKPAIIWAFKDASYAWTGAVTDLNDNTSTTARDALALRAGHVYRLNR